MPAPWYGLRAPSSFSECYDDTNCRLDPDKYYLYRRAQAEELDNDDWLKLVAACGAYAQEELDDKAYLPSKKVSGAKRKYTPPENRIYRDPADGSICKFGPRDTEWYRLYVDCPQLENTKFRSKFRRRFRCSYNSFQKHLEEVKKSDLFKAWADGACNCRGEESSPIELLLLGALRYIGRGWCFDDLEEQTCISEETHRKFMHIYLFWGATTLYNKYVVLPANGQQAKEWAEEYEMAGFPGCISSGDATHIGMLRCYHQLRNHNKSFKLNMPSRTYNTHVTHRRRILHSTPGHPGRWNDKTLQLFDSFCKTLRDGNRFNDLVFELKERAADGTIKSVRYCGAWEIVDNGYLPWPTMIPPSKHSSTYAEMRFSKWIESLRKDVECTFGIMKGRFRILKTGVHLHGIDVCDRLWLTCCALHNFLLEEDGLDERWNASRYLFEDGEHEAEDVRRFAGQGADNSGMGPGSDVVSTRLQTVWEGGEEVTPTEDGSPIPVHTLPHEIFKSKLVQHFDILWKQNLIRWPSRTGTNPPPTIFEH
ncbi:hypothetical protein ACHAWF_016511 [Thalassiosira exigua]